MAEIVDYQLFAATKRETLYFILAVVGDTWLCKFREPVTFYTDMKPSELLNLLKTLCSSSHALDVLALQNEMQHYHLYMEGIPVNINMLKDSHKKSKRAGIPITAATLLVISINTILSTERLPYANKNGRTSERTRRIDPPGKYVQGR